MTAYLQAGDEWVHLESGDRIIDDDLADIENPDDYYLEWTCPECGEVFVGEHDSDELASAGWTDVHIPCASEAELREAIDSEQRIIDILEEAGQ